MSSRILWQVIYWSPTLALATIAGILVWRRLARKFPFFLAYVAVAWAKDVGEFAAYHVSPRAYYHTYWISHLVTAVLMLLATYELSLIRLFPRFYKIRFYRYLFSAVAIVLIASTLSAVYGGAGLIAIQKVINIIDLLQVVALLFFVGLMLFMGRRWERYEFGVALGLGVNAAAFLTVFAVFLRSGPLHGIIRELPAIADALACLIWLFTFLRPEKPATAPRATVRPEVLEQAREWERTLKDSLSGKKREP